MVPPFLGKVFWLMEAPSFTKCLHNYWGRKIQCGELCQSLPPKKVHITEVHILLTKGNKSPCLISEVVGKYSYSICPESGKPEIFGKQCWWFPQQMYYSKWKKPDSKGYMLYDSSQNILETWMLQVVAYSSLFLLFSIQL
jgi:hypothetical protein